MEYTQAACRRRTRWAVRAAVAGSGLLALLSVAAPAAADVSVTPTEAVRGDGANLVFQITNDSPTAAVTTVEVLLPPDPPIAEVYPLSVDDWAPAMEERKLDQPVTTLHGMKITSVTASVKWIAMPDRALPPGGKTELTIGAGPMPEVEKLALGVVLTYSDGTQVRWTAQPGANAAPGERPAPVVLLKAAPPGEDAHAAGHEETAAPAAAAGNQTSYGGWILTTLLLIAAVSIVSLVLQRRRSAPPDPPEPDEETPATEEAMATARSGPAP